MNFQEQLREFLTKLKNIEFSHILYRWVSSLSFINKDFPELPRTLFLFLYHFFERPNEYRWVIKFCLGEELSKQQLLMLTWLLINS